MAITLLLNAMTVIWLTATPFLMLLIIQTIRLHRAHPLFHNDPNRFIIQITTNSRDSKSVNKMIKMIKTHQYPFSYEIWVVIEEAAHQNYFGADRILKVPTKFETPNKTLYKARALEYAREVRISEGIETNKTKILFLDDDNRPSKQYIEKAFHSPFDLSQGILKSKRQDNEGSLLTVVADYTRTAVCIGYCSFFNSRHNPRLVHGEGLVIKANVERETTWDFGRTFAEDLIFGRRASKRFTFGFIPETLDITAPKSIKDLFIQRRRWFWGNVTAMRQIDLSERIFLLANTMMSTIGGLSVGAITIILVSGTHLPLISLIALGISTTAWVSQYIVGCAVNTKSATSVFKTVFLMYPASLISTAVSIAVLFSKPKTFDIIQK